ncbi:hypothetical protein MTP99_004820 [Tenebrio molitor]|nr:hypothetical protein MTP99_004820 [Tenebrio molitor]
MELPRIALLRTQFLQEYMKNVNGTVPHQFVFLDESWIFENGTTGRSWQDNSPKSVRRTKVDGKRHIVLHAGSKEGFIPGAALIFSHIGRDGNGTQNALAMWEEALNRITPATWANTVRHTETLVREWYERELLFDRDEVAPLLIQVDEDSDFEESTSGEESG